MCSRREYHERVKKLWTDFKKKIQTIGLMCPLLLLPCYGGRKKAVGFHGLTRALRSCRYMPKSPDNLFGTAARLISTLFQCREITQIRENRICVACQECSKQTFQSFLYCQ